MLDAHRSMVGKSCLVTGATAGIGQATARELAYRGAVVVIVGRNQQRCAATAEAIRHQTGNPAVEFLRADLSVQVEIRRLGKEFQERHQRLLFAEAQPQDTAKEFLAPFEGNPRDVKGRKTQIDEVKAPLGKHSPGSSLNPGNLCRRRCFDASPLFHQRKESPYDRNLYTATGLPFAWSFTSMFPRVALE